jgi:hypothetical protein
MYVKFLIAKIVLHLMKCNILTRALLLSPQSPKKEVSERYAFRPVARRVVCVCVRACVRACVCVCVCVNVLFKEFFE